MGLIGAQTALCFARADDAPLIRTARLTLTSAYFTVVPREVVFTFHTSLINLCVHGAAFSQVLLSVGSQKRGERNAKQGAAESTHVEEEANTERETA